MWLRHKFLINTSVHYDYYNGDEINERVSIKNVILQWSLNYSDLRDDTHAPWVPTPVVSMVVVAQTYLVTMTSLFWSPLQINKQTFLRTLFNLNS